MNPRETQAGGSARDHLSAVEAHVKADSTTPACRFRSVVRSACVSERPRPKGHGKHGFAHKGEAMPHSRL
jgi:hypothetical protein